MGGGGAAGAANVCGWWTARLLLSGSVYRLGMATKQKAKPAARKAKKVPVDPAEERKQAVYERRQALRIAQGIEPHQ